MTTNPKISIVIPVYNGSNYLREAIESALAQSYQNIEVIVVNDGSDDGGKTESVALSFGNKIRYFFKENGGVASALNFGIRQMTGEWFAWLSHDDLFSKNRCEEDINVFKNNPDARIIFCKIATINENGKLMKEIMYPLNKITSPRDVLLLGGVHMCAMTIHESCFSVIGVFDEKNRTTQDVQMSLLLSSRFPFYLNNKSKTCIRDHREQGTHSLSKQHKKDLIYLCDFMHDTFTIDNFFPELKNNQDDFSNAFAWMGIQYYFWGSSKYAGECFVKSVHHEKNILKKILIGFKITHGIIIWCNKEKIKKGLQAILPNPIYHSLQKHRRKFIGIVRKK
jgi:glycosyltransferase involved in cell wall biosynthesis